MKLLKLFLFLFLISNLHAQFEGFTPELPVQSTVLYKKSNVYQQDFLYLCEGLVKYHANVFLNFPKSEFNKEKDLYYKQLDTCNNEYDFGIIANRFTNRIRDRHTGVKFDVDNVENQLYPFRCKYLVDTLVIMAVSSQLPFSLCGERIKSINGYSINDIENKASQAYATENYVDLQKNIMLHINSTEYLKYIGITHSDTDHIKVSTFSGKEFEASPNFNGEWKSEIHHAPLITDEGSEPFSYKIVKKDSLCYIQFNRMIDKRAGERMLGLVSFWKRLFVNILRFFGANVGIPDQNFEDFLNPCLKDIKEDNVKKVIVDLRWNSGGSSDLGELLLYALGIDKYKSYTSDINESELYKLQMHTLGLDKKISTETDTSDSYRHTKYATGVDKIKNRFHGNVYFIISEWTFSSAVILATVVKDNHFFTIVGEPISERPSHFGEVLFLKLPNTGDVCRLSCKLFHRPDKTKDTEETLYPDITIYKTYENIIRGIDGAYNWIVQH